MNFPKISVIVSTYNSEEWLRKVLWGFHYQTFKGFEVVIADEVVKASIEALSTPGREVCADGDGCVALPAKHLGQGRRLLVNLIADLQPRSVAMMNAQMQ